MKKVDIIHGGWLKAPNGASSVLRTLAESTSKFEEYGIQLSVLFNGFDCVKVI